METQGLSFAVTRRGPWLYGARWDVTWLMGTAIVVPITLALVWGGISSEALNLAVTVIAGGPHVFATFLTTYFDPQYRRRHGWALAAVAVVVPALVVFLTITRFQQLLSFFIFAASFHVLQQNAYLADAYRRRFGRPEAWPSRVLDYMVLFLSFYPIAAYKLVRNDFTMGDVRILIPDLVKTEFTCKAIAVLFAASFLAWSMKTLQEWRNGVLNRPKTALILLTSTIAFMIPAMAAGERMELAFQAVNTWHSLQYLGIIWLILNLRKAEGKSASPFVGSVSGPGRAAWKFYGLCLLFTAVQLAVILTLKATRPFSLSGAQYHYIGVFSVLFIHYTLDGYFFVAARSSGADPMDVPFVVPIRSAVPDPSSALAG
ncbi:MAG TPA: hypothetical protein VE981_12655 [Planctomycetota bacterium]|nr:hypothetical protein [Planctomycetota bacterium]